MSALKLMGVLLDYPQDALWQHGDELSAAVNAIGLPKKQREKLQRFVSELLAQDTLEAQDRWLSTFDRGRAMSLLLFEHIHGESRDRGQAMVDLTAAYRKNGFELATRELPDYLPLVLEYLSLRPAEEALDWLHNIAHIIGLLAARAAERKNPYAVLLTLLVEIADEKYDLAALRQRASQEERDDMPEAMDRVWEEEMVRFGVDAADCKTPAPADEQPLRFTNAQ